MKCKKWTDRHETSVEQPNPSPWQESGTQIFSLFYARAMLISSPFTIGTLSKPWGQRQQQRCQTKGLMSRTIAVHVRYNSLYILLPFSGKQQHEMTKFCVFWRTYATTADILDFLMELIAGITYLVWAGF